LQGKPSRVPVSSDCFGAGQDYGYPEGGFESAAAAKVLVALLDKLRSTSARGRRGGLALVRTMTEKGSA
jgi:hypothetical protein